MSAKFVLSHCPRFVEQFTHHFLIVYFRNKLVWVHISDRAGEWDVHLHQEATIRVVLDDDFSFMKVSRTVGNG